MSKSKLSTTIKALSIRAITYRNLSTEEIATLNRYIEYGYLEDDYTLGTEYYALVEAENNSNSNVRTKIH